jgi:hypothetical protein
LVELGSQLDTECADRDRCRTFWLKRKNCIGSGKNEKLAPIAIGVEVRSQLETERASRKKIGAQLSELKKNSAPAATLSEKLEPDTATILSQLGARRKKSPVSFADIEAILEIIEES